MAPKKRARLHSILSGATRREKVNFRSPGNCLSRLIAALAIRNNCSERKAVEDAVRAACKETFGTDDPDRIKI